MLMCALLLPIAHETAGAARTRHSLRPLIGEGGKYSQTSGAMRRGNAELYPRHCERSEAIHIAARRKNGLLRRFTPRNDVERAGIDNRNHCVIPKRITTTPALPP